MGSSNMALRLAAVSGVLAFAWILWSIHESVELGIWWVVYAVPLSLVLVSFAILPLVSAARRRWLHRMERP